MSSKPGTLPRWATDQTNNDAPSSGQKDTGWTPNQDGVSDYDNWVKYWTYKWIEWLNDGDVSFDDLTTNSVIYSGITSYALNGDVTVFDPLSSGNTNSLHTVVITPSDNFQIKGMVNGTNGQVVEFINAAAAAHVILKLENAAATTDFSGSQFFYGQAPTFAYNSCWISPKGRVLLRWRTGVGWEIVSTSGCKRWKRFIIPVSDYQTETASSHTLASASGQYTTNDSTSIQIPIVLPEYGAIGEYKVYVKKQSSGSNTIKTLFASRDGNDAAVTTEESGTTNVNNANNPGFISLYDGPFANGSVDPVSPSRAHWLQFSPGTTGFNDILLHAEVLALVPV